MASRTRWALQARGSANIWTTGARCRWPHWEWERQRPFKRWKGQIPPGKSRTDHLSGFLCAPTNLQAYWPHKLLDDMQHYSVGLPHNNHHKISQSTSKTASPRWWDSTSWESSGQMKNDAWSRQVCSRQRAVANKVIWLLASEAMLPHDANVWIIWADLCIFYLLVIG